MKYIAVTILFLFINFNAFSQAHYLADADTIFKNSGVKYIPTDKESIKKLTNLGMLWGYIKYYHPNVRKGDYNMDAALFRLLPKILSCPSLESANKLMEVWLDSFGVVKENGRYKPDDTAEIKQMPNYGYLFDKHNFSKKFIDKLTFIKNNPDTKDWPYYLVKYNAVGPRNERRYADSFPDAGTRLLALYRYWNVINYFYPYRHLIDGDWNKVLSEFIPVFCAANDTPAYVTACERLIARIGDSHSAISEGIASAFHKKYYTFPIRCYFIEDKLVVFDIYDTLGFKTKLMAGDIIEEVDGLTIKEQIEKNRPLSSVSNYSTLLSLLSGWGGAIFCSRDTVIHLKVRRGDQIMTYDLPRCPFLKNAKFKSIVNKDTAYKIIDGNIGYIYAGKLRNVEFQKLKNDLNNTKGMIIDLRGYPGTFMPFVYGNWLKCGKSPFAKIYGADVDMPGRFIVTATEKNGSDDTDCYKGRIIILVNSNTMSQAEYTTMALSSTPNAIVIGDTTDGADGDVAAIILPGDIYTYMSGLGILYPDGRETQKIGVKIDKIVKPTIKGVLEGKDEVLEAAISLLEK